MIFKSPSDSDPNKFYEVDTEKLTCTCSNFRYSRTHKPPDHPDRLCKHLYRVFQEHPELKPIDLAKADMVQESGSKDPDGKTRFPIDLFDLYVFNIRSVISDFKNIKKVEVCGSYRRLKPTVSDLDIVIVGDDIDNLLDYFENILGYSRINRGSKKASYLIDNFVRVDFLITDEQSFPYATLHFTGSKATNIEMRNRALSKGYRLNEYGLFDIDGKRVEGLSTEEQIFKFLDLEYLQPHKR